VFGDLKPEEVTTDVLNKYVKDRTKTGASRVSVNRELGYLRRSMRLGAEATPPKVNRLFFQFLRFPIDKEAETLAAKTGTIDAETFDKIYYCAPDHFRPIFTTLYYTGIRSKELRFIRPEQVRLDEGRIYLRKGETKDKKPRKVGLNEFVIEELLKWHEQTQREYPNAKFFFHFKGEQLLSWKTTWRATLRRAGLQVKLQEGKVQNLVRIHDTRRTMATQASEDGVHSDDWRKQTGHKSDVYQQYDQDTEAGVERVVAAQNKRIAAERAEKTQAVEAINAMLQAKYNPKPTVPAAIAPVAPVRDLKAVLTEYKELFQAGLMPEDVYKDAVAKALATR
jgi:integrase